MKTFLASSLLSIPFLAACGGNAPPPHHAEPHHDQPVTAPTTAEHHDAPPTSSEVKPQPFQETDDPSDAPKEGKVATADGRPKEFKPGAAESVWIWQDAKGSHWHVRTTTKEKTHRFHGVVIGDTELANVKSVKTEAGDRWKLKGKRASFDFYTTAAADGLDFDVKGNSCVRYVLFVDGKPVPVDQINLGKDSAHPQAHNFKLCP